MKKLLLPIFAVVVLLGMPSFASAVEGDLLWSQVYNLSQSRDIVAYGVVSDDNGVYAAGWWQEGGGSNGYPYYWRVEKRSPLNGDLIWEDIIPMSTYSSAYEMTSDASSLYIAGESWCAGGSWNCRWRIEKRDKSDGNIIWVREIDPTGGRDIAWDVEIKNTKVNVYGIQSNGNQYLCRIASLNASTGAILNQLIPTSNIYCGSGAQDDSGAYYIAGNNNNATAGTVQKIDSSDGSVVWSQDFGGGSYGIGNIDTSGIYGTRGFAFFGGSNITLEKRNLSSGEIIWSQPLGVSGAGSVYATSGGLPLDIDSGYLYIGVNRNCVMFGCADYEIQRRRISDGGLLFQKTVNGRVVYSLDSLSGLAGHIVTGGRTTSGFDTRLFVEKYSQTPSCGTVTDARDGTVYDTVVIGSQCWMRQNMNVGTMINAATAQTNNSVIEKYCYNNDPANCTTNHPTYPDGGLYTWDEAMQYSTTEGAQGICPAGWHIPTDAELYTLEHFVDSTINDPNATGWRGTDASIKLRSGGSSGLEWNFAGYGLSGIFLGRNPAAYTALWSSSQGNGTQAWSRGQIIGLDRTGRGLSDKISATPVRCLQGAGVVPPANVLQLCRGGVAIAQSGGTYNFSLPQGSPATFTAHFDTTPGNCEDASNVTALTTFTEANPSGGVISVSGSNPKTLTASASLSGTEAVTASYSGQSATLNATVSCLDTTNYCAQGAANTCSGETYTGTYTTTCGATGTCNTAGTRYCDFNWKEVAPGQ